MARTKGSKDKHFRRKYDIAIYTLDWDFEGMVSNGYELAEWLGMPDPDKWMYKNLLQRYWRVRDNENSMMRDYRGNWHRLTFIEIEKENL